MKTWLKEHNVTIIGALVALLLIGPLVPFVKGAIDSEVMINGQNYEKSTSIPVSRRIAVGPRGMVGIGGLGSGTNGGYPLGIPTCNNVSTISLNTATTFLLVSGLTDRHIYICSITLVTAGANNVILVEGTGSTCGTGTQGISSAGTTAATGWNFLAGSGIAQGSGFGMIMRTFSSAASLCIITSAATQLSGVVTYAMY